MEGELSKYFPRGPLRFTQKLVKKLPYQKVSMMAKINDWSHFRAFKTEFTSQAQARARIVLLHPGGPYYKRRPIGSLTPEPWYVITIIDFPVSRTRANVGTFARRIVNRGCGPSSRVNVNHRHLPF